MLAMSAALEEERVCCVECQYIYRMSQAACQQGVGEQGLATDMYPKSAPC